MTEEAESVEIPADEELEEEQDLEGLLGPALAAALDQKGYTTLTPVQEAVLAPELANRDLRISSQTGSGKTVAIGFTLRDVIDRGEPVEEQSVRDLSATKKKAYPRALVVTPTRELAKQVGAELTWLFAPLEVGVAAVTGGGQYRDELRALAAGPGVVVGTPGRLLDHLDRKSIDPTMIAAVVFDEADRMLDLGFRDDLERILGFAPPEHRTHLVSATFPREVLALADRVQSDPVRIEGTPLGSANQDIEHLVHMVQHEDRFAAIVNLLLATPDAPSLVFARTRADVAQLTQLLSDAGFTVDSLSGEMEQRERNRALSAFKNGKLHALVATDVAARGIDVPDVVRVIHGEPPTDADSYTHRSGRTGRAGRKGTSSLLVTPPALNRVSFLLKRARVQWRFEPVPSAAEISAAHDDAFFHQLTEKDTSNEADDRAWNLAKRIVATGEGTRAIARLLGRSRAEGPEAREVRVVTPPRPKDKRMEQRPERRDDRGPERHAERRPERHTERRDDRGPERHGDRREPPRGDDRHAERPARPSPPPAREAERDDSRAGTWVPFRITWGQVHGADARRLVAMLCRRGGIRGSDIGAIRVSRVHSVVEVAGSVAKDFERATSDPDPRDPRVKIHRDSGPPDRYGDPAPSVGPGGPRPGPGPRPGGPGPRSGPPSGGPPGRERDRDRDRQGHGPPTRKKPFKHVKRG